MSPHATPDAAAAIRAVDAEFSRLANLGDAAALVDVFYAEDATLLPPNLPPIRGTAAIREFWAGFIAGLKPSDVTLDTARIEASGDLAYGIGAYSYMSNGERHTGKYAVVFRRSADGGYQCVADAFGPNA